MPKGPKGEKRPTDVIGAAVKVMKIATGEIEEDIDGDGTGTAGEAGSMGKEKLEDARTVARRGVYAKLLVDIYLKDRDRDTSIAAMGEEISGISVGGDNGIIDIPKSKQVCVNISNYFEKPVTTKARNGDTYMISITLCLLKIPSAAEILAFGRIGVRSGHA